MFAKHNPKDKPPSTLPTYRNSTVLANLTNRKPHADNRFAINITFLRPKKLDNIPHVNEPTNDPIV